MDKKEVKLILQQLNFSPKKHLGQNFLIDNSTKEKITDLSAIAEDDVILEIGAGLGALTKPLLERAQKVYAYELDPRLFNYLKKRFREAPNLTLINSDILKPVLPPHNKVISNPPYSITGPLLEKLFFKSYPPEGILLIEYQIAKRIFNTDNYKDFSRLSVTVNSFMEPIRKEKIPQTSFYPKPNIKLSLIKLKPRKQIHPSLKKRETRQFFLNFIRGIFPYKNKNLSNAIQLFLKNTNQSITDKEAIKTSLKGDNFQDKKVFDYQLYEYPKIAQNIYNLIKTVGN